MDQTEEQQVERLKEFWAEHGKGIIAGAVIGFGLFFGWRYYDSAQIAAQNEASAGYQAVISQLQSNADNAVVATQDFISEQQGTQYADLAALQLAQHAAKNADLATAVTALESVTNNSGDANLVAIANLRMARVLLAQEKYEPALAALKNVSPEAYKAAAAELEGDIYAAQGQNTEARAAYQRAIDSDGQSLTPALQLKLNSLATS